MFGYIKCVNYSKYAHICYIYNIAIVTAMWVILHQESSIADRKTDFNWREPVVIFANGGLFKSSGHDKKLTEHSQALRDTL